MTRWLTGLVLVTILVGALGACAQEQVETTNMTKTKTVWDALMLSEDGSTELLGQVAIEDGMLSIVSLVDEDDEAYVQEICDGVNGMEELIEKAPPPEGAERYELGMKTYTRDSADIQDALIRKLEKGFALRLVAPE